MQVRVASHSTSERRQHSLLHAATAFSALVGNEGWGVLVDRVEHRISTIDGLMSSGAGKLSEREFDCLLGERKGLQSVVSVPQKTIQAYEAVVRQRQQGASNG